MGKKHRILDSDLLSKCQKIDLFDCSSVSLEEANEIESVLDLLDDIIKKKESVLILNDQIIDEYCNKLPLLPLSIHTKIELIISTLELHNKVKNSVIKGKTFNKFTKTIIETKFIYVQAAFQSSNKVILTSLEVLKQIGISLGLNLLATTQVIFNHICVHYPATNHCTL